MSRGFLLDENLPVWWRGAIRRLQPHLRVWRLCDPGAPPRGTPDLLILQWCDASACLLLTNNRHSMPQHLAAHVAKGQHMPGIFIVDPAIDISDLTEQLSLIEGASLPHEYQDQIRYLPLT